MKLQTYWQKASLEVHFLVYLAKLPEDVQEYLNQAWLRGYRPFSITVGWAGVLIIVERDKSRDQSTGTH